MTFNQRLATALLKAVMCPLGWHRDKHPDGSQGNFCGLCGAQTNPHAFKDYSVTLTDGSVHTVSAINKQHAQSLVVYGPDLAFDAQSGSPIGDPLVHPSNIQEVAEVSLST